MKTAQVHHSVLNFLLAVRAVLKYEVTQMLDYVNQLYLL